MKFNYGTAIFLALALFCLSIIGVIIYINANNILADVVIQNYYEQDIKTQENLKKEHNFNTQKEHIVFETAENGLKVVFPTGYKLSNIKGTLEIMRYSDQTKDRTYTLENLYAHDAIIIPSEDLIAGLYRIKIDWEYHGEQYLVTQDIQWK